MLPSTEAQAGVQNDHFLTFIRFEAAPTGSNQKRGSYLERFEVAFPGFRPVFAAYPAHGDGAGAYVEPAGFGAFQSRCQLFLSVRRPGGSSFEIEADGCGPGFDITIRAGGFAKGRRQQLGDCVLRFRGCRDRDFPEWPQSLPRFEKDPLWDYWLLLQFGCLGN